MMKGIAAVFGAAIIMIALGGYFAGDYVQTKYWDVKYGDHYQLQFPEYTRNHISNYRTFATECMVKIKNLGGIHQVKYGGPGLEGDLGIRVWVDEKNGPTIDIIEMNINKYAWEFYLKEKGQ